MRDRVLTYAIVASIVVHGVLLLLVGRTSAAKPIQVDQLKVVRVDLVKTPDQVKLSEDKPNAPKPAARAAEPEPAKVDVPYVPPISKMVVDKHPPKPVPVQPKQRPVMMASSRVPAPVPSPSPTSSASSTAPAGNPGGEVNMGTVNRGQDMGAVPRGSTPVGWVGSGNGGSGQGSGTGAGVGTPEPTPNAHEGSNTHPAPVPTPPVAITPVAPPPPPQPKMVSVTVCTSSGMLPGRYCDKKETRVYREGTEPRETCDRCKAPEPVHINRMADRSEPELIKDVQVKIPDVEDSGDFTVWVRYTVDTDGKVSDVEVTDGSGVSAIDRAVREAVSRLTYKPAVQNGEPRSVKIKRKYKISF